MKVNIYDWIVLSVAVATYMTRLPSLWLGRYLKVSTRFGRGLSFIPIGVFTAIIAPTVFSESTVHGHVNFPFLVALIISISTAILTKSPLWTMILGVISIAILRAVIPV